MNVSDFRKITKEELVSLYSNKTCAQIANDYSVSEAAVRQKLIKFDIPRRKLNSWNRGKNAHNFKDVIGQRFGRLVVVERVRDADDKRIPSRQYAKWKCVCDCGKETVVGGRTLRYGATQSCGCLKLDIIAPDRCGELSSSYYNNCKKSAANRGYEWELTPEYLYDLFLKQNKKCSLSGVDIILTKTKSSNQTASLDRIDSTKGYVVGNVQWVHKHINIMKNVSSNDEFLDWCLLVVRNKT